LQSKFHILVVEDNRSLAATYHEELSELGENILVSHTIESALKSLENHQSILAVLTDYRLQDGDGLSLVSLFRLRNPNRPWVEFIIVTGHGTLEVAQLAINADVRQFLTKPVASSVLKRALTRAVETAEARQRAMMAKDTLSQSLNDIFQVMSSLNPIDTGHTSPADVDGSDYKGLASSMLDLEKRRHAILLKAAITEREWLILIQVYVSTETHKSISLKSAAYDLAVPLSTLVRIVNELCEMGYLNRRIDPDDARRSFLELTTDGRNATESVLRESYIDHTM